MPWNKEPVFAAAAVWCVPVSREGYQSVLRYSVDRLRSRVQQLVGKLPLELKYSAGLRRYADGLVALAATSALEDRSIMGTGLPWTGFPLRYTVSLQSPSIEGHFTIGPDLGNLIRARSLVAILLPLTLREGPHLLEVGVIADADVWKRSMTMVAAALENAVEERRIRLDFSCESSRRVPGLQIADLVSGITRDYHMSGHCSEAWRHIRERTVDHIT